MPYDSSSVPKLAPLSRPLATDAPESRSSLDVVARTTRRSFVPKISVKTWDVPPEKIFHQLFGKEVVSHEYTRDLVPGSGPVRD